MSHFSEIIARRMEKAGNLINAHMASVAYKAPEHNFFVKGLIKLAPKLGINIQPLNMFMARWDKVSRIIGFTTEWNGAGGLFDPLVNGEKPLEGVAVGELVKTTDDHGRKILIFMTELGPVVIFQRYNAENSFSVFAHLPRAVADALECDSSGDLGISTYEWLAGEESVIGRVEAALKKKAAPQEGTKAEDKAEEAKAKAEKALDEFAQAAADLNKEAEDLKTEKVVEATTEVGKAFRQHLLAITNVVDFVPAWHGETDYFEGVARGSVFVEPLGEKPVKTVDDHGRSMILMQTQKGMIVIFQRYSDNLDTVYVQMSAELAKIFKLNETTQIESVDLFNQLLGDPTNPERTTAIDMVKLMNSMTNGSKH